MVRNGGRCEKTIALPALPKKIAHGEAGEQVQMSAVALSHLAEQLKTQVAQFRM
jgi:hypothetical protein